MLKSLLSAGVIYLLLQNIPTTTWVTGQGYSIIPSGTVMIKTSGTCPAGWSESAALNGKFLQGTVAANNNIGQSAGNVTLTNAPLQPAAIKVIFCSRN